ncbi:hypothetical protein PG995_000052 [Apiospora arundinis]
MAVMKLLVFTLASLWLFELSSMFSARNICPKPVPGAWGLDCSVWATLNRQADPRGPEDHPVLQPRRWGNRGILHTSPPRSCKERSAGRSRI